MNDFDSLMFVYKGALDLQEDLRIAQAPSCHPERAVVLLASVFRRWDILFRVVQKYPHLKDSLILQVSCPEVLSRKFAVEVYRKLLQLQAKNLTDGL